jgi:hypothetical protein
MERFQTIAALFFAFSLSVWLGRADLHTDDTGVLVGLIGCGSILLAIVEPRRPWIWGMIVPAGVIGVEAFRNELGTVLPIAGLTIAIASAGAYFGAFVRRLASTTAR